MKLSQLKEILQDLETFGGDFNYLQYEVNVSIDYLPRKILEIEIDDEAQKIFLIAQTA